MLGIRIVGDHDYTLYANQALLDMFGYKNIEELRASPPQEHYSPESYAAFAQGHEQFLRGESLPDQLEFDIIRKDGVIRHLQLSSKNVLWNGKQQHQMLYSDITEHKTMEANNAYLASFPEMNTDPIIEIDREGQLKYFNPACKYNFPDIETLGLNHPILADWAQLAEELCPNGLFKTRIHEMSIGNLIYEQSYFGVNENRIRIYCRDITERKNAERALQTSEDNFHNSLDTFLIGIRITSLDCHALYVNRAFLEMFGYENIEEARISPPQEHYTSESYAEYLRRKGLFERGESVANAVDSDIICKDGAIRHLRIFNNTVFWDGKEHYQSLYLDITERIIAEKRLEQAAQEWRTTFDSITDLISIHDKDHRIVRVNKTMADVLKTTPQELVGKFCHEVMRGDQECPANCPQLLALRTGKPSSLEIFNPNLGLHFQESASPVFNEKGEITGTVLVARDVSQQKRMEEQLILTDRLASIGELSSGIAHELNNPLTSVIGFSQLLMEGDVPANIKEDLGIVYSEAQRAAVIVKNLLTFARKHAPVKQLSQVNTVIEDVLRLRAYEQKVNNIEVETRLAPGLPEIMIDHFQMQQVFLNIMVNGEFAMLETHHRGKMVITTERLDGVIRITFTDNGSGISEENLKHIFDPFFTTKEVGKGTGLGLSICHGIVTEHGGKIYARSEKGQGTTFVVELPLINGQ